MKRKELISLCKAQRIELKLSQEKLAANINQPRQRIVEFEAGRSNLTCDALLILLEALGVTLVVQGAAKPVVNQAASKPLAKPLNPIKPQPAKFSLAEEMARLRSQ